MTEVVVLHPEMLDDSPALNELLNGWKGAATGRQRGLCLFDESLEDRHQARPQPSLAPVSDQLRAPTFQEAELNNITALVRSWSGVTVVSDPDQTPSVLQFLQSFPC
jgi:hypothetical protein